MNQSDKDRLKIAESMAEDFLTMHRECSYDNKTDEELANMERLARLARQVTSYTGDYNKDDDSPGFGG